MDGRLFSHFLAKLSEDNPALPYAMTQPSQTNSEQVSIGGSSGGKEAPTPLSLKNGKGASINDICKIFGFFDPLPPLARIWN